MLYNILMMSLKYKNKNNNKMLKSGSGKLMMTNGISISEFSKKYNL